MEIKKKILVVDDEEEVLYQLSNFLKRANYEVFSATKGREAIELAKKVQPNLIILDVILPDMDGGEVANILSSESIVNQSQIIFLTGVLTKEEEFYLGVTGKHHVVAKPVTGQELLEVMQKVLPNN